MRISINGLRATLYGHLRLMSAVAFSLLFALSADAAHEHDADPGKLFDCEICLKHGQEDDIAIAKEAVPSLAGASQTAARAIFKAKPVEIPPARSRSPPATD